MELKKLRCQNCGAILDLNDGVLFCSHCGEKLLLDDGAQNINITYKIENTALIKENERRIKEIESRERLKLQKLEKEERENKRNTKIGLICGFGIPLIMILIGVFCIYFGNSNTDDKISAGYYKDYVDKNYKAVETQLEELGFENIVTIDLDDASLFWNKSDTVESVSINGNTTFESFNHFYPTDKVIITYH